MSAYTSFFTGNTSSVWCASARPAQYINSSRTASLVIPCVSHKEDCAVGNVRGEAMKLTVGFILIFCAMENVRCSGGRSPSRLWNYLKEFAWDRSTDADSNRRPVLPLQVHANMARASCNSYMYGFNSLYQCRFSTEFHMMRARFYAPEV